MMSETRYVHVFKVNMSLTMSPIKKRSIRLYPKVGPVPVAPDAPLPDMLDWPA
jgi:hypothetical protein